MEKTFKIERYEFIVKYEKEKERFFCHIPAYDIIFGAKDEEQIEKKAIIMTKAWLDYFKIK